eukprot:1069016-Rhodomonas_salina.2
MLCQYRTGAVYSESAGRNALYEDQTLPEPREVRYGCTGFAGAWDKTRHGFSGSTIRYVSTGHGIARA